MSTATLLLGVAQVYLGKKADVDTGDSFPRKALLELQGLECAGGRLPAWIHSLKRDVVTAFALAWSGDYRAFQHEKEFLGSIEDVINARTLEYISSGAASYAEVHGMSDRIVFFFFFFLSKAIYYFHAPPPIMVSRDI